MKWSRGKKKPTCNGEWRSIPCMPSSCLPCLYCITTSRLEFFSLANSIQTPYTVRDNVVLIIMRWNSNLLHLVSCYLHYININIWKVKQESQKQQIRKRSNCYSLTKPTFWSKEFVSTNTYRPYSCKNMQSNVINMNCKEP